MVECECCGKQGCDPEEDFCYGCRHVICDECSYGEDGDILGWDHTLDDHKRALERRKWKEA